MIKQSRKPASRDSRRCHHRFANGTRCRMPALAAGKKYCPLHADLIENESGADAAEELMDDLEMNSADDVRVALSRLIRLVAENRITPRRAYIITRICAQLLRSLNDLEAEVRAFHERGESWNPRFGLPADQQIGASPADAKAKTGAASANPGDAKTDAAPAARKKLCVKPLPMNGHFLGIPLALPSDPGDAESEAGAEAENDLEPVSSS